MKNEDLSWMRVAVLNGVEGVGPGVVSAFAKAGAHICVGHYGHAGAAEELSSTARMTGATEAMAASLEPTDARSVSKFFDICEQSLGGLDVTVQAARPVTPGRALEESPEDLRQVVDQELTGPILCMREAAQRMLPSGWGRLISFVTMSGKTGVHTGVAPFAAAKGGLIAFSRVLAAELASTGVTVNTVATALFEPQVASMSEERRRELLTGIPVGRFGRSEEAGQAVLYLASENSGFVTGETLNLSGGRFMD